MILYVNLLKGILAKEYYFKGHSCCHLDSYGHCQSGNPYFDSVWIISLVVHSNIII